MGKSLFNPPARSISNYLHLFVLVTFALAQPLYDILGQNPEFFVANQAGPVHIISLILLLSIGGSLIFVLIELIARIFGENFQCNVHRVIVFLLVVLVVAPPVKRLVGDSDLLIIALVLTISSIVIVLYMRLSFMQVFVSALSPVVIIFPLLFVFATPIERLVMPQTLGVRADIHIENKVPVVVVVLDEFSITALLDSQGKIDPVRFPNFAAFAAESFWFPNAVLASQSTVEAVPSILTGRNPRPKESLTPTRTDYPDNLFTLLEGEYSLSVAETVTSLHTEENNSLTFHQFTALFSDIAVIYSHLVAPPKVSKMLPTLDARWTGFGQDIVSVNDAVVKKSDTSGLHAELSEKVKQQEHFLSQIKSSSSPGLYFIHTTMPHIPYHYLASGHRYSREQKLPEGIVSDRVGWLGEESLIITAYNRYLQQVGYADNLLGNLKNKLMSAGIYDKSLVIITADHGVAFQPLRSRRIISDSTASEILKVPMFVKRPGQKVARVDERIVSSIDVLPTIIDVLEIDVAWKLDGYSMFSNKQTLRSGIEITGVGHFDASDIIGFPRLEWQVEHFGERSPLNQLIPKGPYYDLVRRNVDDFQIGGMVNMLLKSNDIDNFQDVNIEEGSLPSLFRGYIEGSDGLKLPLAISVNGIIWATTNTSKWDEQKNYFSVLLPLNAFNQGRNVVKVYLIEQSADKCLLRPIKEDRVDITLSKKQLGTETLAFGDGRKVLVETHPHRKNMDGYLDWVTLEDGMLIFEGWAVDLVENQPASNVLIFKGEKLVWQVAPTGKREGVAKLFKLPTLSRSGYRATVPLKVLESHPGDISVIAISKDKRAFRVYIKDKYKELIRTTVVK